MTKLENLRGGDQGIPLHVAENFLKGEAFSAHILVSIDATSSTIEKATWDDIEWCLTETEKTIGELVKQGQKSVFKKMFDDNRVRDIMRKTGFDKADVNNCIALSHIEDAINYYFRDSERIGENTARDLAWCSLIQARFFYVNQKGIDSYISMIQGASKGGYQAGKNRVLTRYQVKAEIKKIIGNQNLWGGFSQTAKSITDMIWPEIEAARDNGEDWQGISNADLQQAKVGRKTVYDAVKQTHPR